MDRDHEAEQEVHRRRLMLMRMQGDVNRSERRLHRLWGVVVVLTLIALWLSLLA